MPLAIEFAKKVTVIGLDVNKKKIEDYQPSDYFTWSIHLDGDKAMHDKSVCLDGTYEKAVAMNKTMPAQANARIVAAYRPGESLAHFVIVSGPFDSLGKAYESIKRKEATKNSWVRATKTLQDQITGPTRPQEVRP